MEETDKRLIEDLLNAARLIRSYVDAVNREAFRSDVMRRNAVTGRIIAMAGLTKRISDELKTEHQEIPWSPISSFGDLMVRAPEHAYPDEVWEYAKLFVPELIEMIEPMCSRED